MLASATFKLDSINTEATGRVALNDQPQRTRRAPKRAPAAGSVCLVVSSDSLKQLMFSQAAQRSGWKAVVCGSKAEALEHAAAGTVGMALVDTSIAAQADRRSLVESLSANSDVLTVVCGRTSDWQEEIWARENRAWMYLPGVAPESDIDPILSSAKQAASQLRKQRVPAWMGQAG